MQFRNLNRQYQNLKKEIDSAIQEVLDSSVYIGGEKVKTLERMLADYIGVKHCITCANGTDALQIALICMGIGNGDAVFVPDFTFFASAEAPAILGATPVFVDVDYRTYNIDCMSLEAAIKNIINEGKLIPKVIVSVDLFGLSADYDEIRKIADKYGLLILEDSAQGFGALYKGRHSCSFGDISSTSFFPAKPLGCYGDGGAIFTDNDEYAEKIRSICIHGKGTDKYHNVRLGTNSRLDSLQAAILIEKFRAFVSNELDCINRVARRYNELLSDKVVKPVVSEEYYSSWAQYTIQLRDCLERKEFINYLKMFEIPVNVYYPIPMHRQQAFTGNCIAYNLKTTELLCNKVVSIPIDPYITDDEIQFVTETINSFFDERQI